MTPAAILRLSRVIATFGLAVSCGADEDPGGTPGGSGGEGTETQGTGAAPAGGSPHAPDGGTDAPLGPSGAPERSPHVEGVELIESVIHAGVDCFLIRTETADYYFDKEGAGLASVVDLDGHDWIGWSRASGHLGQYRGIPNLGNCCHPGYTGALTTVAVAEPDKAVLRSVPEQGSWETRWEFFPTYARMTVVRSPGPYYILYEGTPGGALGQEDRIGFADGSLFSLADGAFLGDLPAPEWVYFIDTDLGRALLLLHPQDDDIADTFWTFNTMTVFGFGRTCQAACRGMSRNGDQLVLALTNQTTFQSLERLASQLMNQ